MAETDVFGEVAGQLGQRVFSGILWFGIGFIILCVIVFVMWYFFIYRRKFNIEVKIISERAGEKDNILFDTAAILYDRKTKSKYFRLWKTKVELPVPDFRILQSSDKGDYIEIYRTGEDDFAYLLPPKIGKIHYLKSDGKITPMVKQETDVISPDLAYWTTKRKNLNKSMFDPDKLWMKMIPFIPQIIGGVILIFTLYILMSYLPNVLAQLKALVTELNKQQTAQVVVEGLIWSLI